MILDAGLVFSSAQAITTTADSTSVIDITGVGAGTAPAMIGDLGTNTAIGTDLGASGHATPWVVFTVSTAPTSTTNTLTITLSGAPDNGSYSAGTYTALTSTPAITGANLPVGTVISFPVPPISPGAALNRFYKLTYTASATLTAMVASAYLTLEPPTSAVAKKYPTNYVAA
jgi:hypothetical protein